MQLRCIRQRIPGTTDVSDHIATRDRATFVDLIRVVVQVRVIKTVRALAIELINRQSTLPAYEEFSNDAVGHRANRRAARPHYVDRLVTMPMMNFVEGITELFRL